MSERPEPGNPLLATQLYQAVQRSAKDFTRTERLTAYNLLLVECILEYCESEQGIDEAVALFEQALREGFMDQDTRA